MISRMEQSSIIDGILKEAEGKCPKDGCVGKKPNGKWGVMSNKTGKWWPADYDSEKDADDGLKAYHVHKGTTEPSFKARRLYHEAISKILGSGYKGEKWLDNNSHKLTKEVKTLQEAKNEVSKFIKKK